MAWNSLGVKSEGVVIVGAVVVVVVAPRDTDFEGVQILFYLQLLRTCAKSCLEQTNAGSTTRATCLSTLA